MSSLAVLMITFNEEYHIGEAIDNVRDIADEIYILDSLSTDRTVDIALEKGAVVLQRPFTNFGDQWNFALQNFPIRSTWTMKMDPDERLTEELKQQIRECINTENYYGFSFDRRLWFLGKPLRAKQEIIRGWRTGSCHFSDTSVNEHPMISGEITKLSGFMEHLDSPTLYHWQAKQNVYSTMEAIGLYRALSSKEKLNLTAKEWFKYNMYRFPFCFIALFLYHYIAQKAFLDGLEGFIWSKMRTNVYRMRWYKYIEFRNYGRVIYPPKAEKGDYHPQALRVGNPENLY